MGNGTITLGSAFGCLLLIIVFGLLLYAGVVHFGILDSAIREAEEEQESLEWDDRDW